MSSVSLTASPDAVSSGAATVALPPAARRHHALVEAGRRLAVPAATETLLRDAAMLVAETLQAEQCGILLCPRGGEDEQPQSWLWPTAAAPLEKNAGEPIAEGSNASLARRALAQRRPLLVADVAEEAGQADASLLQRGLRSALWTPLVAEGEPLGAIGTFHSQPGRFGEEDLLFAEAMSHLLSTSLARRELETALREQQRRQEMMLATIDALVVEMSPRGRIRWLNRACLDWTGYETNELVGRPIWGALLVPEEVGQMQQAFDRLLAGESPVEVESYLLTRQSERRRVAWSFAALRGAQNEVQALLGTALDVSELQTTRENLKRAQGAAQAAKKSLQELQSKIAGGASTDSEHEEPFSVLPEDEFRDRRSHPRRAYPYRQLLAPMLDEKIPELRAFREVLCRDIAAGGFSFVSRVRVMHPHYVVAFGAAPVLTYVIAEVVHQSPLTVDGKPQFLVGCRYTGRIK